METKLPLVITKALPGLANQPLTYNAEKNVYLTQGWTSSRGNLYYRAIRGTKGLAVFYDLSQGDWYTFINGITLYGFDGDKPRMIAKRQWGGTGNWRAFGEESAKRTSISMLCEFLESEAKRIGQPVSHEDAHNYATMLIEQTHRKCLA